MIGSLVVTKMKGGEQGSDWALLIRYHDIKGIEYRHIAFIDDHAARDLVSTGDVRYLYADPEQTPAAIATRDGNPSVKAAWEHYLLVKRMAGE